MGTNFEDQVIVLYEKAKEVVTNYLEKNRKNKAQKAILNNKNQIEQSEYFSHKERQEQECKLVIPIDFEQEFFKLIDQVNLNLMEDEDNFYGYFLFQMKREIRFDISSPTAVNFKGAKYVIYFNPIIFLTLTLKQMETTIKHEILHIVSMHLMRAKEFKDRYSTLAINIAMDVIVNKYLNYLPPYATTLEWVNLNLSLELEAYQTFEYYVEKIQKAIHLLEEDEKAAEDDSYENESIETEYSASRTHDIWDESSDIDEKTLHEFTEKFISYSEKGESSAYLKGMIASLKNSKGELPWNLYLKRLMGSVESNKKKSITRRDRRQPERFDLRGQLRSHKANIAVALDISGSISDEEFKQAMKEVLSIVKNYNHEITLIECDDEIRRVAKIKTAKDLKDRIGQRGSTKFSPVFEYANKNKINLLIYFTDGKGENKLSVVPRGYQVLWVISGRGDQLSLREPYGAVKKLSKVYETEKAVERNDFAGGGYSMNHQEKIV